MALTVKEARERKGFSQVDAGRAVGISEPTYRKYEREPWLMSIQTATELARVLEVEFVDLKLEPPAREED